MRIPTSLAARCLTAAALALVVTGCSVAGATGSPNATGEPGTGAPAEGAAGSSNPAGPSGSTSGFYLRAWTERGAEPNSTFTWPAAVTIAEGVFYDGHVAVPAIYPGPLLVTPFARTISVHGIDTIAAEAKKQGLLGAKTDFTGGGSTGDGSTGDGSTGSTGSTGSSGGASAGSGGGVSTGSAGAVSSGSSGSAGSGGASADPGVTVIEPAMPAVPPAPDSSSRAAASAALPAGPSPDARTEIAHLTIVVDGVRHELTGDTTSLLRCRCLADPGTPGAFAAFWQRLEDASGWLGADLGPAKPMTIERLAVLTVAPEQPAAPIEAAETSWPLAAPFSALGTPSGSGAERCAVVSKADLARLLPLVEKSNALTRFVDSTGAKRSLVVRVLTTGEPSPCGG